MISSDFSGSECFPVDFIDSESLRAKRLQNRREKKKFEKKSYVSLNGEARNSFRQSKNHYLHLIEKHPERGFEFAKIVE